MISKALKDRKTTNINMLLSSADNLCKQSELNPWFGSKLFDTLVVFLKVLSKIISNDK